MKTKGILLTLFAVASLAAFAQDEPQPRELDPKVRDRVNAQRIAFITERLGLTPEQAERFWPVYNEFTQKRVAIRQQFRDAQRTVDPNKPDPQKQEDLVKLGLKLRQDEVDLEKDYSGRIMRTITAQQLLNLRKAEQDFRSLIINTLDRRRIMQDRKENLRDQNQKLNRRRN
jgi:hypothetical protein